MFKCKLCGKVFESRGAIPNHMFSLHRVQVTEVKALWDKIVEELSPEDMVEDVKQHEEEIAEDVKQHEEEIAEEVIISEKDDKIIDEDGILPEHDDLPEEFIPSESEEIETKEKEDKMQETIKDGVSESIVDKVPEAKEEDYFKKAEKELKEDEE